MFSDDNLNFGIKTLEEIKLKKLKEKTKKQGGELISPTFLSCLLFTFCPFFFSAAITWIAGYALVNTIICKRKEIFWHSWVQTWR